MPGCDLEAIDFRTVCELGEAGFLVVAERPERRARIVEILTEAWPEGPKLYEAPDGASGAQRAAEQTVVLVFCDLPGDGERVHEGLLDVLEALHPLPVVAVCETSDGEVASTAIGLGAQDCVSLEELSLEGPLRIVRHAIERQALQIRLEENLQELEQAQTRFQSLITDNADALVIVDSTLVVKYANPAAERLLGRALQELDGTTLDFPLETRAPVETCITDRNGQVLVLSIRYMETLWNGERAYIATLRDITEQKSAEEALALAKKHAEQVSNMKSLFLANMSHELRTPLNSILGFSEIMSLEVHGALGHDRYKGYVENISGAGRHLLELINDLLDLSKVEAGKLEINDEVFDVGALLREVASVLGPRAEAAEVRLKVIDPGMAVRLRADLRQTKQILFNLLSNAIKFTPDRGLIQMGFRLNREGSLSLFVSDNGIGIPADQIPKALSAFGQVESPYTRRSGEGTGLGLTLSKKIAELHGGSLKIQSAVAKGTSVIVTFPVERLQKVYGGRRSSQEKISAVCE